eukprot:5250729-Lingulodinium_polyedra.AAC.1
MRRMPRSAPAKSSRPAPAGTGSPASKRPRVSMATHAPAAGGCAGGSSSYFSGLSAGGGSGGADNGSRPWAR